MNSPYTHESAPGLEGPDYVTLVIEWDEGSEETILESVEEPGPSSKGRTIATVVGALAAIAFATWGIRHLRPS